MANLICFRVLKGALAFKYSTLQEKFYSHECVFLRYNLIIALLFGCFIVS